MKRSLALLLLLTSCAGNEVVAVCPVHVQFWTPQEQKQVYDEERKYLPTDAMTRNWIEDYITMRDEARKCR